MGLGVLQKPLFCVFVEPPSLSVIEAVTNCKSIENESVKFYTNIVQSMFLRCVKNNNNSSIVFNYI